VQVLARPIRGDTDSSAARISELSGERSRGMAIACTGNTAEEAS